MKTIYEYSLSNKVNRLGHYRIIAKPSIDNLLSNNFEYFSFYSMRKYKLFKKTISKNIFRRFKIFRLYKYYCSSTTRLYSLSVYNKCFNNTISGKTRSIFSLYELTEDDDL